ncbi:hypothetical protein VI03_27845 [Burkholderia vietnamiensis]|uniref:hypothetical protein n=1 Tax=Burkholderia vietnamiensis TaxID=60552 RepID=UPI0006219AE5|nr:hypothetical protein [Burkholderia vietnamiensis]KKI35577.1 hypothetical protein VI03_27845 [Burkholderia vietnamiensis]
MMQPNFQELIGKTMSNLTFGLADGNFTWGKYAVFLIVGASLWIAIPRYVAAWNGGIEAANRATAIAAVALLFCLTPLTAIIGAGLWLWAIISALRIQRAE